MMELIPILLPAFVAGLLVLSTHIPLGYQVLKRGIIFIDLAIAQVAALGIVMAHQFHFEGLFTGAEYIVSGVFAVAAGTLLALLEKRVHHELEAVIGCCYVLAATAGLLVLAHDPHGGELLKQTLSGSILWVTWDTLLWHGLVVSAVLLTMLLKPNVLKGVWFYALFAIAITSAVELVGVYLVFASLIMVPLATQAMKAGSKRLFTAYGLSALAYALGLTASAYWDLPSGATLVWCLALIALCAVLGGLTQPAKDKPA
ncbi:metal ABC transporter permease [Echinimonas agarilytica]|uniref:Metal ABC transporter permease n=1 Tax=Echinimonas agarilytica TaxID=1215918 RepID=A0AA42B685_9GAMM|nr:metal ABC transporter permease [Echinimonas agarilytica]MCM2678445.1 metal ABC transporter permease [Echinimonas agarilytica]